MAELRAVTTAAAQIFTAAPRRAAALTYLRQRGINPDHVPAGWPLGYAPPGWTRLVDTLRGQYSDQALLDAGLARVSSRGSLIDTFRDRVIFPVHHAHGDLRGQVAGFIGRDLSGHTGTPKYLNSRHSSIYVKSELLYGLHEGLHRRPVARATSSSSRARSTSSPSPPAPPPTRDADLWPVAASGTAFTSAHARQIAATRAASAQRRRRPRRRRTLAEPPRSPPAQRLHLAGARRARSRPCPTAMDPADYLSPTDSTLDTFTSHNADATAHRHRSSKPSPPKATACNGSKADSPPHGPSRAKLTTYPVNHAAAQIGWIAQVLNLDHNTITDELVRAFGRQRRPPCCAAVRQPGAGRAPGDACRFPRLLSDTWTNDWRRVMTSTRAATVSGDRAEPNRATSDTVACSRSPRYASALAISRDAVYELLRSGRLPSVTLGRSRRIRVTDLDRFVASLPRAGLLNGGGADGTPSLRSGFGLAGRATGHGAAAWSFRRIRLPARGTDVTFAGRARPRSTPKSESSFKPARGAAPASRPQGRHRITVAEWLTRWADTGAGGVSTQTLKRYRGLIRNQLIPLLGHIPLADLRADHVRAAAEQMARMPARSRRGEPILGSALSESSLHQALDRAYTKPSPTPCTTTSSTATTYEADCASRSPALESPGRALTLAEARMLLTVAQQSSTPSRWLLALTTGIRQAETLGLSWPAVDWKRRRIDIGAQLHYEPGSTDALTQTGACGSALTAMTRSPVRAARTARTVGTRPATGPARAPAPHPSCPAGGPCAYTARFCPQAVGGPQSCSERSRVGTGSCC